MPTSEDCSVNQFQIVYDQILQEAFTILGEKDYMDDKSTVEKKLRNFTSPVYFENLTRPPHITLFWQQNLNGELISCSEIPSIRGLTEQLQKVHDASLVTEINGNGDYRILLSSDQSEIESEMADSKQKIAKVLLKLVRKHKIKSMLVNIKDTPAIRDAFLELGVVDKIVFIISSEFGPSKTSTIPFKLVNLHHEMLDEFIVVTGDPRFPAEDP